MRRNSEAASEIWAHWATLILVYFLGSIFCGMVMVIFGGYVAFEVLGNQFTLLSNEQTKVLYGMVLLIAVHFGTRGWWLNTVVGEVEDMIELHKHAMSRINPQREVNIEK